MSTPKEGTNRLTLDLPQPLHKAIKRCAVEKDTTMRELLEAWARRGLAQDCPLERQGAE